MCRLSTTYRTRSRTEHVGSGARSGRTGRVEPRPALQVVEVRAAADVPGRRGRAGVERPRADAARAEPSHDEPPLALALEDAALELLELPVPGHLLLELLKRRAVLRVGGEVDELGRIGGDVVELVRIARAHDQLVPAAADHHDRSVHPLRQVLGEHGAGAALGLAVYQL